MTRRFSGKIPSVGQFQTKVPFDRVRAMQALRTGVAEVAAAHFPGSMEWLQEHHPEVLQKCRESFRAIIPGFAKEDLPAIIAAVQVYVKRHREAFDLFVQHNPRGPRVILKGEQ